jgi:hypothetical protein
MIVSISLFCCKEQRVAGNATHHKYEFKVVDEGPTNGVTILFVLVLILTAFDECFANETVHRRGTTRGESLCCGRKRARPENEATCKIEVVIEYYLGLFGDSIDLCGQRYNYRAWWSVPSVNFDT